MKLAASILVLLGAVGLVAWLSARRTTAPIFTTAAVTRGPIVKVVASTGTLQAVTSVEVGAQVSGIIASLGADYNSIVHRGEVLATLEQSTFQAAVDQAAANVSQTRADAERLRVSQSAADIALGRDRTLAAQEMLPAQDLEGAQTDSRTAAADVVGADAKIRQAEADLQTARVNLAKTIINSPIDGVVIARNVDVGQTVSSSFSAPTLFVIAADLTKMQINANIDESDVGMVKAGQEVVFHVDAYPAETFHGTIVQVRLNAATVNNVVTYAAMIDAPNPQLKLKPGMTANLTIEIARRDNVLRVPAAALRFKPPSSPTLPSAPIPAAASTTTVVRGKPAPAPSATPTVWRPDAGGAFPVQVRIGLSDGTLTELLDPPFGEGTLVVTQAK
jgi:HlyD family secretion protein